MSIFQSIKAWIVADVGLAKDALHIYVALALFLGSAAVFRWRLSQWRPWLVVAAAAVVGEIWDIRDNLVQDRPIEPWRNWHDIWNTLFWPTMLLALARWRAIRV